MAASESIVSNIKGKRYSVFSQKHVAQNRKFSSKNLKAKAKFKSMDSQEWYEKFSEKKSVYI